MKRPLNVKLMADLAILIGTYDPEEVRDGLRALADPDALADLTTLIERTIEANIHRKPNRQLRAEEQPRIKEDEHILRIKAARPEDANLIDEILLGAKEPWSKSRVERLRSITLNYNQRPITGKSSKQRRSQILSLIEYADRSLLEEMAKEFRRSRQEGATLQDWSNIIRKSRKSTT